MSLGDYQDYLEAEVERARQEQMQAFRDMPEDEARALFEQWRAEAQAGAGVSYARCIDGEAVVHLPYGHALGPGHIYSEAGIREFKITRICEFHFDQWTAEPDEEEEP